MTSANIWTANKFIKEPTGNGGCPRVPTLETKDGNGNKIHVNNNEEKAKLFAKTFFPDALNRSIDYSQHKYPKPLPDPLQLTKAKHIAKLSLYKAHRPDGILNIVLQQCTNLITNQLTIIFRTILNKKTYFDKWHDFTMVVLRKPGKPSYETPKAYRPIALISTMAKLLTLIVAGNLSQIVEQHQILPKTHFGGRPVMQWTGVQGVQGTKQNKIYWGAIGYDYNTRLLQKLCMCDFMGSCNQRNLPM